MFSCLIVYLSDSLQNKSNKTLYRLNVLIFVGNAEEHQHKK